jgi:hypothetical protein
MFMYIETHACVHGKCRFFEDLVSKLLQNYCSLQRD